MSIRKIIISILIFFPLQSYALDCPDNTNKVEFTSPVTGEDKKWCQLNIDGKLLKHGPLVIYKDGRLAKKEFYIKGKLQKVGLFKAVEGESLFHFDAFLACVLQANHKTVKCRQSITLPQPHHVFHRSGEEYTFEFPYKINDLYNDYLSLCGYSEELGDLICYDPSFHRIKERLKKESLKEREFVATS